MFEGKLASLGGIVAAVLLGAGVPAEAGPLLQNIIPFGDNRDAMNPPVARYASVRGQSFVFDRESAPQPLLKFDDDPEVWVLDPAPAPRGDVVYRNDVGETVLRVTRLGGLTLFTPQEPGGMPVAMLGGAETLQLPAVIQSGALPTRAVQQALRVSRAVQQTLPGQHPITFEVQAATPGAMPLFADAFTVVANGLVRLARKPEAKPFLSRLDKVSFVMGLRPDVRIEDQVMVVTIAPGKGFAGRPSSDRVMRAVLKR